MDNEIHNSQKEYDIGRTAEMEKYFIKVIRFTDSQVDDDLDSILNVVRELATDRIKSPPWGLPD